MTSAPNWLRHPRQPDTPGWYVASTERSVDMQRYWNGVQWSAPCWVDATPEQQAQIAPLPSEWPMTEIEWLDAAVVPVRRPAPRAAGARPAMPAVDPLTALGRAFQRLVTSTRRKS